MTMQDNTKTAASIAANDAETVRVALSDALAKAKTAGTAVLVKLYGAGADSASVTLARRAASVLAGGDKPRGGQADRINRVLKAVATLDTFTPADLAHAARTVLDEHKAAMTATRKAASEERAAAKAVLNDRGRAKADRIAAFELITELDGVANSAKANSVAERVHSALIAARDAGMSAESIQSLVLDVYPVEDTRAELLAA